MKKIINPWAGLENQGYNCFGCSPSNPIGLKLEFLEDGDEIVSYWMPGKDHQGWLDTLHGGIQATLIDEVTSWNISRKLQRAAMTVNLNVRYRHPVSIHAQVELRSHIRDIRRNMVFLEASVIQDGKVCTTAEVTYCCFSKEQSEKEFHFTGCEIEE